MQSNRISYSPALNLNWLLHQTSVDFPCEVIGALFLRLFILFYFCTSIESFFQTGRRVWNSFLASIAWSSRKWTPCFLCALYLRSSLVVVVYFVLFLSFESFPAFFLFPFVFLHDQKIWFTLSITRNGIVILFQCMTYSLLLPSSDQHILSMARFYICYCLRPDTLMKQRRHELMKT